MKTFVKILLILWWLLNITQAYVDEIDPYSWKSNVEKTILIEKYLIEHKTKIVNFSIKYNAERDTEINRSIDKIMRSSISPISSICKTKTARYSYVDLRYISFRISFIYTNINT